MRCAQSGGAGGDEPSVHEGVEVCKEGWLWKKSGGEIKSGGGGGKMRSLGKVGSQAPPGLFTHVQ